MPEEIYKPLTWIPVHRRPERAGHFLVSGKVGMKRVVVNATYHPKERVFKGVLTGITLDPEYYASFNPPE